jgi:hypothetical protein
MRFENTLRFLPEKNEKNVSTLIRAEVITGVDIPITAFRM